MQFRALANPKYIVSVLFRNKHLHLTQDVESRQKAQSVDFNNCPSDFLAQDCAKSIDIHITKYSSDIYNRRLNLGAKE